MHSSADRSMVRCRSIRGLPGSSLSRSSDSPRIAPLLSAFIGGFLAVSSACGQSVTTGNASYPRTLLAISSPGESFAVGDPVFPRSSQAELRIGKTLIAKAIELSYPVFVRKMTGDWIYVRIEAKKTDAWIQRKDVCTTSEAPAFFTSRIAAEPTDRHAWWMRSLAREAAGDLAAALEDAEHLLKERQSVKAFHLRGSLLMAK